MSFQGHGWWWTETLQGKVWISRHVVVTSPNTFPRSYSRGLWWFSRMISLPMTNSANFSIVHATAYVPLSIWAYWVSVSRKAHEANATGHQCLSWRCSRTARTCGEYISSCIALKVLAWALLHVQTTFELRCFLRSLEMRAIWACSFD